MNGGVGGTAPDSVSLAIAFFQAPGRFPDLLHGATRLPPQMGALLHLAANGETVHDGAALPPFVSSADMRQAALFFIEQVLLAHNANHYRVLGVNDDAPLGEIKEHHRLLMRLFHPDRQAVPAERSDAFATRINQAYTVLRSPAARTAYDLSLRQPKAPEPLHQPGPGRYAPIESGAALQHLPPVVARNLPQFVLGGVAMIAALAVGLVYVTRVPPGAIGAGEGSVSHAPPREPPQVAQAAVPAAVPSPAALHEASTLPAAMQESAIKVATLEKAAVMQAEMAPTAPENVTKTPSAAVAAVPQALTLATRLGDEAPRPVSPARPSDRGERSPPRVEMKSAGSSAERPAQAAAVQSFPASPPPEAAPKTLAAPLQVEVDAVAQPQGLRPEQLSGLLAQISEFYEKGDLEALMSLFDENARIEKGGKTRIRGDYADLFRTTEARELYIRDVMWTRRGEVVHGEGRFEARVVRKGESAVRIFNGSVRIEIVRRNNAPLIIGLFHTAG